MSVQPEGTYNTSAAERQAAIDNLPPPGDERREVLKRRLEKLQAEIEAISTEMGSIDPAKLKIDREVAVLFTGPDAELYITNADPNYKYTWVYRDPWNKFGGRFVFSYMREGWEVVRGDLREAWEKRSVTGERWAADTLLMRMRVDKWAEMHRQNRARRRAMEGAAKDALEEMADRKGVKVHTDFDSMPGHLQSAVENASTTHMQSRRGLARSMAAAKFEQAIRTGTVPGLRPGVRP